MMIVQRVRVVWTKPGGGRRPPRNGMLCLGRCSVDNEPVNPVGVKLGEEVLVERGDVADWMYNQNGKLKGGYTIVALTYGTPEQDEYTKKMGVDWGAYKFLKGAK